MPIDLGSDWKYRDITNLRDACKDALLGWIATYPSGLTSRVGDYAFYLGADKLGAVYNEDEGSAVFKPYGVLMLSVK